MSCLIRSGFNVKCIKQDKWIPVLSKDLDRSHSSIRKASKKENKQNNVTKVISSVKIKDEEEIPKKLEVKHCETCHAEDVGDGSTKKSGDGMEKGTQTPEETTRKPYPKISNFLIRNIMSFPINGPCYDAEEDYQIEDSKISSFPSVTTILSETMSAESRKALEKWKQNMIARLGSEKFLEMNKALKKNTSTFIIKKYPRTFGFLWAFAGFINFKPTHFSSGHTSRIGLSSLKMPIAAKSAKRLKKTQTDTRSACGREMNPVRKSRLRRNCKRSKKIVVATLSRGSRLHKAIKSYLLGKDASDIEVDETVEGCWRSVMTALPHISNVKLVESWVYHPHLHYKGIVDCVACFKNVPHVIEWKQSEKTKKNLRDTFDAPIQLCAYMGTMPWCKSANFGEPITSGLVVIAYVDGSPADIFPLNQEYCQCYWEQWLRRVQQFWLIHSSEPKDNL